MIRWIVQIKSRKWINSVTKLWAVWIQPLATCYSPFSPPSVAFLQLFFCLDGFFYLYFPYRSLTDLFSYWLALTVPHNGSNCTPPILLGSSFYPGPIYPCPWPLPLTSLMTSASISNPTASEILNLWSSLLPFFYILVLTIFSKIPFYMYPNNPQITALQCPSLSSVQPSLHSNASQSCQAGENTFSILFFLYVFVYFCVWCPPGPEECWHG